MVDKAEFFRIADEIVAAGREPSQRSIREQLARGGSFSELGPLFVEWAMSRGYRVRPTKDDLPDHLKDKHGKLAAEIWHDGYRNGMTVAQNERDLLQRELQVMATRADTLEEMLRAMRQGADANPEMRPQPEVEPDEFGDAAEFWSRVMQEVYELLGDRALAARAILGELPEATRRQASERDGAWGPGRLSHKMRQKIRRGQMFLERHDGLFCRRPEAA